MTFDGWSFAIGFFLALWVMFMVWILLSERARSDPPRPRFKKEEPMPLGDPDPLLYGYRPPMSEKWTWKGPVEVIDTIQKSLNNIEESLNRIIALLEDRPLTRHETAARRKMENT